MISCFQVTVRDNGRPPLSSTTRVVIEVADINDHGPEFEQKFYTVQIPASPATDKPLFQVEISSGFARSSRWAFHSSVSLVNTFPRRRMDRGTEQRRSANSDPNLSRAILLSPFSSPCKKRPPLCSAVHTCRALNCFNSQCGR